MLKRYRIYDHTDREIVANSLETQEQAYEVLELLKLNYPAHELEIESYEIQTVKPGFGRDPDLH